MLEFGATWAHIDMEELRRITSEETEESNLEINRCVIGIAITEGAQLKAVPHSRAHSLPDLDHVPLNHEEQSILLDLWMSTDLTQDSKPGESEHDYLR